MAMPLPEHVVRIVRESQYALRLHAKRDIICLKASAFRTALRNAETLSRIVCLWLAGARESAKPASVLPAPASMDFAFRIINVWMENPIPWLVANKVKRKHVNSVLLGSLVSTALVNQTLATRMSAIIRENNVAMKTIIAASRASTAIRPHMRHLDNATKIRENAQLRNALWAITLPPLETVPSIP